VGGGKESSISTGRRERKTRRGDRLSFLLEQSNAGWGLSNYCKGKGVDKEIFIHPPGRVFERPSDEVK